jgi:hypothetical protein
LIIVIIHEEAWSSSRTSNFFINLNHKVHVNVLPTAQNTTSPIQRLTDQYCFGE